MTSTVPKTDPSQVSLAPYHPDTPEFRYTFARYCDQIRSVDSQIGVLIAQLEADGLLEDTFIFYFADHGGVLPRGKGYAYESGLHIPLVVRVPENWIHLVDRPLGSQVQGFVSHVDLGATVQRLAGAKTPEGIDGQAFLGPGVSAQEVDSRDEAFGYADRFDEKYDLVRTLRKGRYEYVRSYQPFNYDALHNNYRYNMLAYRQWRELYRAEKLNDTQRQFFLPREPEALYDVNADPHETRNLAGDPMYASVLADLRERMRQRVKSMPDLSFYPESLLVNAAASNPVAFGQKHKQALGALVGIADLQLMTFDRAQSGIGQALNSNDPWQRYWGLIVCSRFGKSAALFADRAKELAAADDNLLVRTRAAEFLGLIQAQQPQSVIKDCLAKTASGIEAGLILNSVVLLRDGEPGCAFNITASDINSSARDNDAVQRRLEYLDPSSSPPPINKKSKKQQGKRKANTD